MKKVIPKKQNLKGNIYIPGDKSISHRSIMFGSIANGVTNIENFLNGADCISTISCFKQLGIKIEIDKPNVTVYGKGLYGLTPTNNFIDTGNSGTTTRLISGILSGQNFSTKITGDSSIKLRPMDRIITPLSLMGGTFDYFEKEKFVPMEIVGNNLVGINYTLPIASAQVKSSIILASLYASSKTIIYEPIKTRNHTELMLKSFGGNINVKNNKIECFQQNELKGTTIKVPGDISSAMFFIVAALISENSHITIKDIGINPTRTGLIDVLRKMGGNINFLNEKFFNNEPVCDIEVKSSNLKGVTISGEIIPRLIDEIPILAVAGIFSQGKTIIKNAEELKFKESNRIKTTVYELKKIGANIKETSDGMIINGTGELNGGIIESHFDHRIAMSLSIAGLFTKNNTIINNSHCIDISFPNFYELLDKL